MLSRPNIGSVRPVDAVYDRDSIARLSNCVMSHLDRADLIAIIRHVEDHIPQPDWTDAIEQCDDGTLLRMAFRARECCRNLHENEQECFPPFDHQDECGCPHCA